MLLRLMQGNTEILRVHSGRRFVLPNGDTVSPAYSGWSSGTYYIEPAPVEPDPELEIKEQPITISRLQAKAILFQYDLLDTVEALIAEQDPIVQLAWKEASQFDSSSIIIQSLKMFVKWPDGTDITAEEWKKMFLEAKNLVF